MGGSSWCFWFCSSFSPDRNHSLDGLPRLPNCSSPEHTCMLSHAVSLSLLRQASLEFITPCFNPRSAGVTGTRRHAWLPGPSFESLVCVLACPWHLSRKGARQCLSQNFGVPTASSSTPSTGSSDPDSVTKRCPGHCPGQKSVLPFYSAPVSCLNISTMSSFTTANLLHVLSGGL